MQLKNQVVFHSLSHFVTASSKKEPKNLSSHSVCHLPLKGTAIASLIEGGGFFALSKKDGVGK